MVSQETMTTGRASYGLSTPFYEFLTRPLNKQIKTQLTDTNTTILSDQSNDKGYLELEKATPLTSRGSTNFWFSAIFYLYFLQNLNLQHSNFEIKWKISSAYPKNERKKHVNKKSMPYKYHINILKHLTQRTKSFFFFFNIYAMLLQFQSCCNLCIFFPPLDLVRFYPSLPFPPFETNFTLCHPLLWSKLCVYETVWNQGYQVVQGKDKTYSSGLVLSNLDLLVQNQSCNSLYPSYS